MTLLPSSRSPTWWETRSLRTAMCPSSADSPGPLRWTFSAPGTRSRAPRGPACTPSSPPPRYTWRPSSARHPTRSYRSPPRPCASPSPSAVTTLSSVPKTPDAPTQSSSTKYSRPSLRKAPPPSTFPTPPAGTCPGSLENSFKCCARTLRAPTASSSPPTVRTTWAWPLPTVWPEQRTGPVSWSAPSTALERGLETPVWRKLSWLWRSRGTNSSRVDRELESSTRPSTPFTLRPPPKWSRSTLAWSVNPTRPLSEPTPFNTNRAFTRTA
mmetsp:Transcript_24047/g.43481  ORF Transcript_24047/g.43481 Transcript_24047/m.43481 type:complete len:269 (+) Transcript_24047:626-1432(+)